MPAEWCNALGDRGQHIAWSEIDQAFDEIEANAAHSVFTHDSKGIIADIFVDDSDATGSSSGRIEGIDQGGVVRAVAACLHDHVFVEAEKIPQCEQLLLWGVDRRVFAFFRIRKAARRPEYMAMGVHTSRRWFEMRLRRIRMKRDIGWIDPSAQENLLFCRAWRGNGQRRRDPDFFLQCLDIYRTLPFGDANRGHAISHDIHEGQGLRHKAMDSQHQRNAGDWNAADRCERAGKHNKSGPRNARRAL